MAEEKEVKVKGIDTVNPDGEPDKNPIIESAKDDIKSTDSFILPETQRDETLAGLNSAALASQKSPVIRGTDFTFNKEISDALDKSYELFDLAKAIPDPNERAEYIRKHGKNMVQLLNPDVQGIRFARELEDLYNFRQKNYHTQLKKFVDKLDEDQGFFDALYNTGQKLIGKTAIAVSSIIPLVVGVGSALINWDANKIFNNTLFDAWDRMDKWTDEHYVVYGGYDYTQPNADGSEKGFFARFADNPMKSLNNDIAPAASFIAGAILTETVAGLLAAPTGGATLLANTARLGAYGTRYFSKGMRLARGLDNLSDVQKAAQLARHTAKFKTGLGTMTTMVRTAGYESSLIARDTYQSTKDKSIRNYINSDVGVKRGLKQKYENIIRENMDEFGNLSITESEVLAELEKDIPKKDRIRIENNAENAGELAWFSNIPLVGFSNMMQFPRIFNSSYRLGQGMLRKAGQKINPLTGTKMVGGKMVARAADRGRFAKFMGYGVLPTVARGLGEGFEEFSQGVFEKGYSNYYSAEFSQPSREVLVDFLPTMASSAKEYFKSVEGQDSIAIGALMGMFGLPGVRVARDAETGKRRLKRAWYGGWYEGWSEIDSKVQQAQKQAEIYNSVSTNAALKKNLENMMKSVGIQEDLDKALKEGDIFNYKNKEFDYFYSFVSSRLENGIVDTVFQDLEALDEMSLTEFNKQYAIQDQEFQYTQAQKDNIIETAKKNVESIIKSTEDVEALMNEERRFVDKIFDKEFLGSVDYSAPLRKIGLEDKKLFSSKGNIDSNISDFVEKEFEDYTEQERYILKENLKIQLRNQLAYLVSSSKNIEKREGELIDQLRDLVGEGGLSTLLSDSNFIRFVVGTQTTTIKDKDGNEIKSTDPRFADTKDKVKFAVSQILADIKEKNPNSYNFNERKIRELVTDLFKLKDKKAKASAFYNMLFTKKGAQEFTKYKEAMKEDMAQAALEAAIAIQEEQIKKANSSVTSQNASNTSNDLNNSNRGQGETLRQKISDQQTKELEQIIDILDQKVQETDDVTDYNELDPVEVIKQLENYPNAFQLIKDRLNGRIPGLEDVDSIPGLNHLESELGTTVEQLVSETLFDIIEDFQTNTPGPNVNPVNADSSQINLNNSFAPEGGPVISSGDLLDLFDDVEEEGGAADTFLISVTNDKQFEKNEEGVWEAQRNDKGKFENKQTDQPINRSEVNDPRTLTLEQIRKERPKARLKFSDNALGQDNVPDGYRAIDIYYVDSTGKEVFYGRIPATLEVKTIKGKQTYVQKQNVPPSLIQLRKQLAKAEVNPDTGFLEMTKGQIDYRVYKATVAPKTETKKTKTKKAADDINTLIKSKNISEIIKNFTNTTLDLAGKENLLKGDLEYLLTSYGKTKEDVEEFMKTQGSTLIKEVYRKDEKSFFKMLDALEKQTTAPETEVEQSAREKAIEKNLEKIIGQIEITLGEELKEMDGEVERTIGEKKCD